MNDFMYYNPVRVHFGADAMSYLPEELGKYGPNVLLTYGGGSIKRTGLYDRVIDALRAAGTNVPKRCTKASSFAGRIRLISFLPSAAAARSTAPRPSPWEHRRRATSGESFM